MAHSKFAVVTGLFLFSVNAQAALSKRDFAYGNEIVAEGGKSVIAAELPESVYQTAKNPNLADLAVFNAKDEIVPHLLAVTANQATETAAPPLALPVFPLYSEKKGDLGFSKMKISTTSDGTILEIDNRPGAKEKGRKISGFLVDASRIENIRAAKGIEKFRVKLEAKENYFLKATLEGSQNLETWVPLENGAVLASFDVNGEKLLKDELPLSGGAFKYYRIAWVNPAEQTRVVSVEAHFPAEVGSVEMPWKWASVAGTKVIDSGGQGLAYQFDTGSYYPVSAVKVQFADQNSIARVLVEAANAAVGPWTQVASASFYTVQREGAVLSNLQSKFPESRFRFWRLKLSSSPGGIGSSFPAVSLGWRADTVKFLARGEGPFVLAYGSAEIQNPPQPDLFQGDWSSSVASGTLKEKLTLGGDGKLVAVIKAEPPPWRKFVLGGVLLLGVILLGGMALQVRKEI